jgi:hypothetical protein
MSLSNLNPLAMPRNFSQPTAQTTPSVSPQEWEYIQTMRRTGWDTNQQPQIQQQPQIPQSDPYVDFVNEFSKCSSVVQNKILNDPEFKPTMDDCDKRIQAMVEDLIRPQLMQTPDGRIAFEKMLATFRQVRDKYSKEESDNLEALQMVMQDEVVKKRIAELNKQKAGVTE